MYLIATATEAVFSISATCAVSRRLSMPDRNGSGTNVHFRAEKKNSKNIFTVELEALETIDILERAQKQSPNQE